jgi:hypothetical protein
MLRAEQNDDSDDDDDMGKLLLEESFAGSGNTSVKLQLFGNLLHSLALHVSPFVFVIEDLQWLDSSSWKMLVQSEHWTHGLVMVCTTRPGTPRSPLYPHIYNSLVPNKSTRAQFHCTSPTTTRLCARRQPPHA